jgi:hypothetical protein
MNLRGGPDGFLVLPIPDQVLMEIKTFKSFFKVKVILFV